MKALVFEYKLSRLAVSKILGTFYTRGYLNRFGFLRLKDIPYPRPYSNNWLTVKTKLCGICGSDHKQIFLDGKYVIDVKVEILFIAKIFKKATFLSECI